MTSFDPNSSEFVDSTNHENDVDEPRQVSKTLDDAPSREVPRAEVAAPAA